jgi:ParB-like chromosome segregation protein Spo0J
MTTTLREIPLTAIVPSRWQPRTTFGPVRLLQLATSIREHGLIVPLTVFENEGRFELVAGERRTRAIVAVTCADETGQSIEQWIYKVCGATFWPDLAGNRYCYREYLAATRVPAQVLAGDDLPALHTQVIVELVQREDVSPIDRARAIETLMIERGCNQAQMSVELGVSQATVSLWLSVLAMDASVQQAIIDELITISAARPLGVLSKAAQERAVMQIRAAVAKGDVGATTVKRVRKLASQHGGAARQRQGETKARDRPALEAFGPAEELALRLHQLADDLRRQAAWAEEMARQDGQGEMGRAWNRMALWLRSKADYAQVEEVP